MEAMRELRKAATAVRRVRKGVVGERKTGTDLEKTERVMEVEKTEIVTKSQEWSLTSSDLQKFSRERPC